MGETNLMGLRVLLTLASLSLVAAQAPPPRKSAAPATDNRLNCIKGLSGCDISLLSPDELKEVSEASKKRNLDSCLEGSTLCDPTRLSRTDAASVQAARY